MKAGNQIITIISVLFFSTGLSAQKTVSKSSQPAPVKLKNRADSIQYALGAYMGRYMIIGGFQSVNLDYFLPGMNDAYQNKTKLINDSVIFSLITSYQSETQKQRGKELEEQLFSVIKDKPGLGKLPSGVQYTIIKPGGKGVKPLETDSVIINYKGTLPDGFVFENTYLSKAPVLTTPGTVIPGLNEVLQLMTVGATWQVFIPAAQAYGEKGNGNIPPNSAVMITVELVEIRNKK
jgi:FKBP-type peptidyl-prolyl cis-trans isomerase FklB